ncbi:MAG TPA: hypothetical protein VMV92_20350 [Streptosporangiaceae bacterium]|nr:hypothetical protein [Streptosporangiaceae bacterium]
MIRVPHSPQLHLYRAGKAAPGSVLLWAAAVLLLGLAAAQGYVSWRAQFAFIDAAKHAALPSALEALGLDTGAVIFALLGLAHARMGRPAMIERALNLACAFGSMTMNLLGANLASPRSVAVYVLPAVLYAACSDRLIATAGHVAGVTETSVWRLLGVAVLYGLRAVVAFPSTALGLRRRLLDATPLPRAGRVPGAYPAAPEPPAAGTEPDALLSWLTSGGNGVPGVPGVPEGLNGHARAAAEVFAAGRTALYRLRGDAGELLYVGVSLAPEFRFYDHARLKDWWPEVSEKSIEWFDTRDEALAAERAAIAAEKPKYNILPGVVPFVPAPYLNGSGLTADEAKPFADDLARGEVPPIRRIRAELRVGQPRAQEIQGRLRDLTRT